MSRIHGQKLDDAVASVAKLYQAMEDEIFRQIIEKLMIHPGDAMAISEWHGRALREFRSINRNVIERLSKATGTSIDVIRDSLMEFATDAWNDVDRVLRLRPNPPRNADLAQIVNAMQSQVFETLDSFINQTLITTNLGRGTAQRMFTNILENTTLNMISGNLTHTQALQQAMNFWTARGIPSAFIDKGGNIWSIERYLRLVLRSTFNRTYNEVRTARMNDYGIHHVLMSTLPDAAPRCSHAQGQVLDMRETPLPAEDGRTYPSIFEFGYGDPGGTLGINCRHQVWPFIPGTNTNNQEQIDPELSEERYAQRLRENELERRITKVKRELATAKQLKQPTTKLERRLERLQN